MAAVTANQLLKVKSAPGNLRRIRLGATERIYENTLVFIGTDGFASASFSSSFTFAGVAKAEYDNTDGSDGDLLGEVYTTGAFHIPYTSVGQTEVGTVAHAVDNYTIAASAGAPAGVITDFIATNVCEIDIGAPRTLA